MVWLSFYYTFVVLLSLGPPPECHPAKVDLCLIVDSSRNLQNTNQQNVNINNWQLILEFSSLLVDGISRVQNDVRVGVIVFSTTARQVFALNDYDNRTDVTQAIRSIQYERGDANIADGFNQARIQCFNPANGDRPDARNVAVLISPGIVSSPSDRQRALAAARELKDAGVTVFTVGVTDVVDQNFLSTAASALQQGQQSSFLSTSFDALSALERLVVDCNTGKFNSKFLTITKIPCSC